MIKLKNIVLFLAILVVLPLAYGQDSYRDPFESILPKAPAALPKDTKQPDQFPQQAQPVQPLPELKIEGILWGTELPQALIAGDIYKVGDYLKDLDAKIYEIKKNRVTIVYQGRPYELGVTK